MILFSTLPFLSLQLGNSGSPDDLAPALQIFGLLTVLSLAPAILLLMTSFTRILIVLSFLRQAIGVPSMPPNQVLIGLTFFLTYLVMAPTTEKMYQDGIRPYMDKKMTLEVALEKTTDPLKSFMLSQTGTTDLQLFYKLSKEAAPAKPSDISLKHLIPAFVISELKRAFQIGFLIYLPFILMDMVVSSVLMAMGMMMLPPTVMSLPLKIVLFVLVDGWQLITGSLVQSFGT
jgi:flagellar biosynthetic protein FliP